MDSIVGQIAGKELGMQSLAIVVPCYNEAERLDTQTITTWLERRTDIALLLVDDGSVDRTFEVLSAIHERFPDRVFVHRLEKNSGKAEAVRQGLLRAMEIRLAYVGYLDADLATPLEEMEGLLRVALEQPQIEVVLASRVGLLGRQIERSAVRHGMGRVFATAASLILDLRVYDTQCGAKILRPNAALAAALSTPFLSRWAFDVELIGRLLNPPRGVEPLRTEQIVEVPLNRWRDVPGSKLNLMHIVRSAFDLVLIARELRRSRLG